MQVAQSLRQVLVALAVVAWAGSHAWAQSIETFEADAPPVGDWHDSSNDGEGLFQEVADGFGGVSVGPAGGAQFGAIFPGEPQPAPHYTHGPHGYPAFSTTPLASAWSYQTDIYTDPAFASNNNGVPDFWWTNALNRNGVDEYLTETGITGEVRTNGDWRFTTTLGGQPFVDLAAGNWYTLEVEYELVGDEVHAHHRILNQAHTLPLYDFTLTSLFQDPSAEDVGGPRYSWFTYYEENIDHLSVDNLGVAEPIDVPESGVTGDLNGDGELSGADEVEFAAALGNLSSLDGASFGDINGDGVLDNFDISSFRELLAANGSSAEQEGFDASALASVPEPSTIVLALFGLAGVALARRRRT